MLLIVGIALIVVAFGIKVKIDRDRFYRTNPSGVEMFESYGEEMKIQGLELTYLLFAVFVFLIGAVSIACHFIVE